MKPPIDVLIPSYNCGQWIDRCLRSVLDQEESPRRVLIIDDASPDHEYGHQALTLAQQHHGVLYLRNDRNEKCPFNLWMGAKVLDTPSDGVIFLLDGDDFLPPGALKRIAEVYEDPDVWLAYGNYEPYPHNTGQTKATMYPPYVVENRAYRQHRVSCFNHPLTFRKHLWDRLTPADLQNDRGQWFRGGYDLVIMMPMLELATPGHWRFLDEHLYWYNAVNPLSDSTINVDLVVESRDILLRAKREQL